MQLLQDYCKIDALWGTFTFAIITALMQCRCQEWDLSLQYKCNIDEEAETSAMVTP